jgi:mono/diheme cytochrome c family protein
MKDFALANFGKIRGQFALKYEGWINVTDAGDHTFYLTMNGGSLNIGGNEIFTVKPSQMRESQKLEKTVSLKAGWNKVMLVYYHVGTRPTLSLEMKGPEFKRGPIPSSLLSVSDKPVPAFEPFLADPALTARGREHFTALGCASCHDDLNLKGKDHTPFSELTAGKGCLSKPTTLISSKNKHPHYHLSDEQNELITKSLQVSEIKELSNIENVHKTLVTFNCIACHEREGVGGISPERLETFTGTHPELGDQGRIPPTLSHVGAKLQPEWIHKVLVEGKRQRPYMNVVMPHYGESNVGHLTELFGKMDTLEKVKLPVIENIKESKNAGYDMIGPKGVSCVACHNFNGENSVGAGALDLVNVTQSLQKNWFHLFMQNPSRFHETGIMPSFWPGGQSIRPDVLDGKPDQQIEALWAYLADGPKAKKPEGLSRQSNDVRVFDKAEIVRGRSPVGYRGIGVGYPERLNLAFDSDEMALRLLWKGEFASVNFGSFNVSGNEKIEFPQGIPFHRLKSMDANWPYKSKTNYLFPQDHGYQFRGYRLDELRRPTFQYEYGDVKVEDFFEDVSEGENKAKFKRTFTFDTAEAQELFYFRAAVGEEILAKEEKSYQIDKLQIRITSDHKGLIREGSPGDLLIPIELPKGKSTLTIEYQW